MSAPSAPTTSLRGSTTPAPPSVTPLAVPPREACRLLSLGISRIYALMRAGELDSYGDGRARRITVASIHGYVARRLADAEAGGWRTWRHNPQARREQAAKARKRGLHKRKQPAGRGTAERAVNRNANENIHNPHIAPRFSARKRSQGQRSSSNEETAT